MKFIDRALLRHIDMLRVRTRTLEQRVSNREAEIERLRMMIDRMDCGLPRELPIGWKRDLDAVLQAQRVQDGQP